MGVWWWNEFWTKFNLVGLVIFLMLGNQSFGDHHKDVFEIRIFLAEVNNFHVMLYK